MVPQIGWTLAKTPLLSPVREWVLYTDPIHVSVVTLEWSEIMGICTTPDTAVKDRRQK